MRADRRRVAGSSHARSLTRLNCAGFRDDASERGPKVQTAPLPDLSRFVLLHLRSVEFGIRPQAAWDPGMTLATILSICIFCSAGTGESILASLSAVSALARSAGPQTAAHEPQSAASAQNQDTSSSSQSAPASPTPAPSASSPAQVSNGQEKTKATRGKRRNSKKTNAVNASPNPSPNCTPPAASNTATADATTTSSAQTPGAPANAAPANTTPAAKCPPEKKIVHEGGTTEPPIQLLGGPGGEQASHQRDTTDQLLGSVQNDLKKVAGRQLNSSQQEMVNQIQQFMEQSKAAVATGDVERGHNLAMKAHLLSAELVKP